MDKIITDFVREYHVLLQNVIYIGSLITGFVCLAGAIRFGIAIVRRNKGIYPPAASQMEEH